MIIVMTTYPNKGRELTRLIKAILGKGLAKCIQRINYMKSYYIREWEIKKDEEKLLLIKTTASKQDALLKFLKQMHPYEIPEITVIQPDMVDESYLAWLGTEEKLSNKKKWAKTEKR